MGAPHLARFSRDVGFHCSFPLTLFHPTHLAVNIGGIPLSRKIERDGASGLVDGSTGTHQQPSMHRTMGLNYVQDHILLDECRLLAQYFGSPKPGGAHALSQRAP